MAKPLTASQQFGRILGKADKVLETAQICVNHAVTLAYNGNVTQLSAMMRMALKRQDTRVQRALKGFAKYRCEGMTFNAESGKFVVKEGSEITTGNQNWLTFGTVKKSTAEVKVKTLANAVTYGNQIAKSINDKVNAKAYNPAGTKYLNGLRKVMDKYARAHG